MKTVLGTLFAAIRDLAIAIAPIIPTSAGKLLDQMGIPPEARDFAAIEDQGWYDALRASGYRVAQPVPLFPRLELELAEG
jgi:methionyl-tRNA synthetase